MSFDQSATAGETLVAGSIHSPNFASGSSGWSINRDGSAEFQNVLVRGTITGSTIIGSTIIGGTITGGIFKSANFDNTAHTGFEINATATPDATATPPVPANTIQIYNQFQVGPPTGNYLALSYNGTASALQQFTGNPADGGTAGGIGASTFVQGGSGRTISQEILSTPQGANGAIVLDMFPSGGTTAADFPGEVLWFSSNETSPSGWDGVTGRMMMGQNATDVWQLIVNNENPVIDAGPTIGHPGLVIGNTFTPQSRLFVSTNELLSVSGAGITETLFLNENNAETIAGPIANKLMRHQSTTTGLVSTFTPSTTNTIAVSITGISCPASGTITAWLKFVVIGNTALTAADFVTGQIQIANVTQSTTPFAASANRGAEVVGTWLNSATNDTTVMTQITATGLGNPGDSLTLSALFQNNSNAAGRFFNVKRGELGYMPSL